MLESTTCVLIERNGCCGYDRTGTGVDYISDNPKMELSRYFADDTGGFFVTKGCIGCSWMVRTSSAINVPDLPGRPSALNDMKSMDDTLIRYTCESAKVPYSLKIGENMNSDGITLFRLGDICTTSITSPVLFQRDSVGTNTTTEFIGTLSHIFWRYERGSPARQLTWVKMKEIR